MYEHIRYILSPEDKSQFKKAMALEFKEKRYDYKMRKRELNSVYRDRKQEEKTPIESKQVPYTLTRKRIAGAFIIV